MDSLQSLGQTGKEVSRLKVLAEQRLAKLYGCQKLWFCIEEMTKVKTTFICRKSSPGSTHSMGAYRCLKPFSFETVSKALLNFFIT